MPQAFLAALASGLNLQWPACLRGRMQPSVRGQASAAAAAARLMPVSKQASAGLLGLGTLGRLGYLAGNSVAVPPPLLPPLLKDARKTGAGPVDSVVPAHGLVTGPLSEICPPTNHEHTSKSILMRMRDVRHMWQS